MDNFYNHMMENLLLDLRKLVSVNEPGTMDEYKTMDLKSWPKFKETLDSIKDYVPENGKLNNLMKYYQDTLYPLITNGKIMKKGFHKSYAFRVDDYDYRQMLNKIEQLMAW